MMTDQPRDLTTAIFTKTPLGQEEIQSRSLGLSALVRRTLVLVDGKRSGGDLSAFVVGQGVTAILSELLDKGCIAATAVAAPRPGWRKQASPKRSNQKIPMSLACRPWSRAAPKS